MTQVEKGAVKADLYEAVNGEWEQTAQIPADRPATGGFNDLVKDVEETLIGDLNAMAAGQKDVPNARLQEAVKLYALAKDFDRRETEGVAPLVKELDEVAALTSYADYSAKWPEWALLGKGSPVSFDIDPDMKKATEYGLFFGAPSLILPEKGYYQEDNPQGPQLLALWSQMVEKLFVKVGYSAEEAHQVTEEAKQFDALLVPHVKSAEERADYAKMYNPVAWADFTKATDQLDLAKMVSGLVGTEPAKVIVTEPNYLAALNEILTDHFALFKSWLLAKTVTGNASLVTDELRILGGEYSRALSGSKEAVNHEKFAYYLTMSYFGQVIGKYYGETYFGPAAKADVEHMVHQMIAVYKQRLEENDWLSPATRQKAIVKLDSLGVQVGYPAKLPAVYDQLKVSDGLNLMGALDELNKVAAAENFRRFGQPVDKTRWEMSAAIVNAYYHPFMNIIVFPAAILQAPFYSLKQSASENYGGIGAVIAHEISHAFDNNGALFDEFGNLNNWWTEEDQAHFKDLAQDMIKEFDGLPFAGQQVNGKLTVSENIADAGGLSCALAAAKQEADYDPVAFFTNWARIWRMKAHEQYQQLLLSVDVHAPNKLRANVQVQNLADFYQAFDVKDGDAMYKAPADRVQIW